MNYIPAETLARWRRYSMRRELVKLTNLVEFRDILTENETKNGDRVPVMKLYDEAADAMLISPETLRHDIAEIRNYPEAELLKWLRSGVSFDHIRTANNLAEIAKKTPAQLLNESINPGNSEGKTMTVKELEAFALSEKKMTSYQVKARNLLTRITDFFARKQHAEAWESEKIQRFETWKEQGKEFFI